MKIRYVKGDLLLTPYDYILHGCNAQGVMGSGVALAIRNKYPKAFKDYEDHFKEVGLNLGDAICSKQDDGKVIINAITQDYYGRNGSKYVSYDAIDKVTKDINQYFRSPFPRQTGSVAMPMIGAGLGGGDWYIISAIIEKNSTNYQPVVYHLGD